MPHPQRYFQVETTQLRRRDPYGQLTASLERLVTLYTPTSVQPGGGLYYGPGTATVLVKS